MPLKKKLDQVTLGYALPASFEKKNVREGKLQFEVEPREWGMVLVFQFSGKRGH